MAGNVSSGTSESSDRQLKRLKQALADGEVEREELMEELPEKKLLSNQHQPEDKAVDYVDTQGSGSGSSSVVEDKDMAAHPGSLEWHLRELERKEEMVRQQKLCRPESDSDLDEEDDDVWFKYAQDIEDSEGFDIEHFPGVSQMTFLVPLTRLKESGSQYATVKNLSEVAINDFNKKNNTVYELDEVLKANIGGCRSHDYYITFRAKNNSPCKPPDEPAVKIFQACVHDKVDDEDIDVLQAQSPSSLSLV